MRAMSVRIGLVVVLMASLAGHSGAAAAELAATSCTVVVPAAGATVGGDVILSAAAENAVRVDYVLDGAYLGESRPTPYGWLFTPDRGRTWHWDSTVVAAATYALTCVATSAAGETGRSAPVSVTVDNPSGCRVVVPTGGQPAHGKAVVFSAASDIPSTATVEYYLHSTSTAVIPLGRAVLTGYGWLYTPDGGRTWGWDSTRVPDGVYGLTCTATGTDGVRHSSATRVFTVDNRTRHDWPSYCADHVPATPADYQAAFDHRGDGWAGADGAHPIPLPDGRIVWLFGDTLAGRIDGGNALLPGWRMPSNSVLVQSGTCFTPLLGGTPQAPTEFLTDADGRRYWPANGYVDTGVSPPVLRLTATHVVNECGWFRLAGVRVFTLALPDLRVVAHTPAPYEQGARNVPSFGTWLIADGDQILLYGQAGGFQCEHDTNGPFPRGTYLARTTRGALATGPWQYWTGSGWSAQITAAAPMVFQGGTVDTVWYQNTVRYGTRYLTATRPRPWGAFGPEVHAWFADHPAGPWVPLQAGGQPVNIIPGDVSFPQSRWHYGGMLLTAGIPGATQQQPLLVFSTNGIGCDPADGRPCTRDNDIRLNVMLYGPHVVRPVGLPPP